MQKFFARIFFTPRFLEFTTRAVLCYRMLSLAALKASNVKGTMEALLLCIRGRPKFLHYVSTVGVFAPLPGEVITELVPPDPHR